jgi:hypothetical protein
VTAIGSCPMPLQLPSAHRELLTCPHEIFPLHMRRSWFQGLNSSHHWRKGYAYMWKPKKWKNSCIRSGVSRKILREKPQRNLSILACRPS